MVVNAIFSFLAIVGPEGTNGVLFLRLYQRDYDSIL